MTKEELRKLASQATQGARITRYATGAKALNITEREWGALVRMSKPAALDFVRDLHEAEAEQEVEDRQQAAVEAFYRDIGAL